MESNTNIYEYYVKRKRASKAAEKAASYGASLTNANAVAALVRKIIGEDEPREHLIVLYLDTALNVVGYNHNAIGSDKEVYAYPREIYRAALLAGAVSLIIAHNHPSGLSEPSGADDDLTKNLKAAGALVGIPLLDHLVVTESGYYSYAERGRL